MSSLVVANVGYLFGKEFLLESVIRSLKAVLSLHCVRCSLSHVQIIQLPVFVEMLPEKLGG